MAYGDRNFQAALLAGGQLESAKTVRQELSVVPVRDPTLDPKRIDLSKFYMVSLYDTKSQASAHPGYPADLGLERLPATYQAKDGIDFDLRGAIYLNSGILQSATKLFVNVGDGTKVDLLPEQKWT